MDNQLNQYDNSGGYNNGGHGNGNGPGGNGGNGNGNGEPPRKPSVMMMVLAGLSSMLVALMLWQLFFGTDADSQVSYSQFLEYIKERALKICGISGKLRKILAWIPMRCVSV